jgi:hemolysin III
MNGITHGLGLLMSLLGASLMYERTRFMPTSHSISCAIYSLSLITLYTSSTLYHSFFTMLKTKFIFEVLDKCAIYLLIAGSYTPFLHISLRKIPLWSVWLLLFIWICCVFGIYVQAVYPNWKNKKTFSLLMYLGMGWACVISLKDLMATLPRPAIYLLALGGLAYTGGVPFFVRNNNLDHSIWHLFVLAGSIFHWLSIYWYVVPYEQPTCRGVGSLDPMMK